MDDAMHRGTGALPGPGSVTWEHSGFLPVLFRAGTDLISHGLHRQAWAFDAEDHRHPALNPLPYGLVLSARRSRRSTPSYAPAREAR